MSHVRTQIRDAAVAALQSLGGVHASRVYQIQEHELPALLVYTNSEEAAAEGFDTLERRLQLVIDIVVRSEQFDTQADDLIADIEAAIAADMTLGGKAAAAALASIEITASAEGSAPIARARMTYAVHYRTTFADPETPL